MRSPWIKWARAVEHQRVLARDTREFHAAGDTHEYVRTDNSGDNTDPHLRVHWRLRIKRPYPERWSILIGDVVTNMRSVLDHAFWSAVITHSGQPSKPQQVEFPITSKKNTFGDKTKRLSSMVAPEVWELVESVQPFHRKNESHTDPLEILRWLSNVDKHRFVHIVGQTFVDFHPVLQASPVQLEVVEEYRLVGRADDGAVVARLKLKRPETSLSIDLIPTFAHSPSIQISEAPEEYRELADTLQLISDRVLYVLGAFTEILGAPFPKAEDLELGAEHEAIAPEFGGDLFKFQGLNGISYHSKMFE